MKTAAALMALSFLASVTAGSAQTIMVQPANRDGPTRPVGFRAQVQMQVSLPAHLETGIEDQSKQQEGARRALYDMAARECRNLKEAFGGDCRLANLSVNTNVQDRRPVGAETINATASATYEIAAEPARP